MRVYASTRPAAGHGAPVGRFAARHRKVTFCSRPIDRPDWRDIGVQRRKFGDQSPGKATVDIEAVLCLAMRAALGRTRQCRTSNRLRNPSSRSEEHTSELQSLMRISYAVFCLKKKNKPSSANI